MEPEDWPQASYLVRDPDWLQYARYAERHFISKFTEDEKGPMRSGIALGYQWGRNYEKRMTES